MSERAGYSTGERRSGDASSTGGAASAPPAIAPGGGLLPALALPKGGGAIRGLGETFTVNPATGTASLTIPIATSPGRAGSEVTLQLSYGSAHGNGAFGLGWKLSTPLIARKTDKGLPRYDDSADVFVLAGSEDLVPARLGDGANAPLDLALRGDYTVQRYRPRVEGAFARIERLTNHTTGDVHWRITDRNNQLSIYGCTAEARIADPAQPARVAAWLLEETRDDRGGVVRYRYKAEDGAGVDPGQLSEASRFHRHVDGTSTFAATAQRYLKRVHYGNRVQLARDEAAPESEADWLFEVVFDYGEHDVAAPTPAEVVPWPTRADPFSSYRATFEIRTYRMCRRVLMFHRFTELGPAPCLVRSTDFGFQEARVEAHDGAFQSGPLATYLTTVTQAGYQRDPSTHAYQRATLPPLELSYARPVVQDRLVTLERDSLAGIPDGIAENAIWTDLDGEGLPGVLITSPRAWHYKANRGGGRLAAPALQRTLPSLGEPTTGGQLLVDLDGDGRLDLVQLTPPLAGHFERTAEGAWSSFSPLSSLPNLDWDDPNLRFIDLDGDGLPELLLTEHEALTSYRGLGERGFGQPARIAKPARDSDGPAVMFSDPTESVHLADMSGSGLVDIVRVRNGEVSYWPNLGYGRFGRKITLAHSPCFDTPDAFDPRRIRLIDLDGSGTSDVVYLGRDGARLYFNEAGNALSPPLRLNALPVVDTLATVAVVDLLGKGSACLVWSSPGPGAAAPLAYVDLFADGKPHLLSAIVNNLGAETQLRYASSTQYYLADQAAGTPWLTRLPFPVHVIDRVEQLDHIVGTRLVTRFAYHHGYYDGHERELGGFARVEQWDAETFRAEGGDDLMQPPVRTVTWFHTGAWLERERLELALAREYYAGDALAPRLLAASLPTGLTVQEERDAARALRGQLLRQEIYADDDTAAAPHPYSVTARDHQLRVVQRAVGSDRAVFFAHLSNGIDVRYERQPADPRILHSAVLAVGPYGDVTESVAISYPRRNPAEPEQARLWATLSRSTFAHHVTSDDYRVGVPIESMVAELYGLPSPPERILSLADLRDIVVSAVELPFEASPAPGAPHGQLRVLGRQRRFYYADDLSGPLPLGQLGRLALPYESRSLALTPGLVAEAYQTRVDAAMLTEEGGYLLDEALWWASSGRVLVDPLRFYLPIATVDPFGNQHSVEYDAYSVLVTATTDPLGNQVTAVHDYRVLAPLLLTDPNGNRSTASFDALGLVVATAVMGKDGAGQGDTLADPTARFEYHLSRWRDVRRPTFVRTLARIQHGAANPRWQETYLYADGAGQPVMTKVQAEPGPVPARNLPHADPRWVGTGRTVLDNKGNAVKRYEPFFSTTPEFEDEAEVVTWGVSPTLRYDPLGRLVRADLPDGTYTRLEFGPWRETAWDGNDTVADSPWLARMTAGTAAEQRAAAGALAHAGTPTVMHLDALGRTFLTIVDNGVHGHLATRVELDLQGNARRILDARGVVLTEQLHDPRGAVLLTTLADSGTSRALVDVAGKSRRSWSARGHVHRRRYDAMQRPTHLFVRTGAAPELLVERTVYGEAHADARARNLRGHPYLQLDSAGLAITAAYDFKDNPLTSQRQLASQYRATPDWSAFADIVDPAEFEAAAQAFLEAEVFTTITTYDARNRVTAQTTADASEATRTYNLGGLPDRLEVRVRSAASPTPFVESVSYNARGQRERVAYGNGTVCTWDYDPLSFRLARIRTVRTAGGAVLQDLTYVYDPVGNIAQIVDAVRFANAAVSADGLYTYDPSYQVVEAEGREHPGQQPSVLDSEFLRLDHPEDLQALRRYRQRYRYDAAGNILELAHQALGPGPAGWTRTYEYAADSNRLIATSIPGDPPGTHSHTYSYDAHGNMTAMPHLPVLAWDHAERLQRADRGGGGQVWFVYDAAGERVRKVYEHGAYAEEQLYVGGHEIYRKRGLSSGEVVFERCTLPVADDARRVALVETETIDRSVQAHVPSTRLRFQYDNLLGSVCLELSASAQVISYEELNPFGTSALRCGDSATQVSARRYRYAGNERDSETGLDAMGARYYAPWLARWTSADPIGLRGGTNVFAYCANNPVSRVDPSGTDWGWLNPSNWCNPFSSDCEVAPIGIAKGFGKAAYHTVRDTGARVVDLSTMTASAVGKGTGWWDIGYTEWSPEARAYDPDKSYSENARGALYNNTVGGVKQLATGIASGDPESIGAGVFVAVLAKAGGGANPKPPLSMPAVALVEVPLVGRIPVLVARTAPVTIPASEALALANTGAAMMTGGDGGGGGGSGSGGRRTAKLKDSASASRSPGLLAKNIGGTKPIPRGTNLALGLGELLYEFRAGFKNTVHFIDAYDAGYLSGRIMDARVFKGMFPDIAKAFVENSGRLKFNLTKLEANMDGITVFELKHILESRTLTAATDFYLNGELLTGAKLKAALKPWRTKP